MWARLKACGWVMKRSTDAAKDKWRYFRPGADANEVPPEKAHFFYSLEDVRAFVDAERVDLVKRFGALALWELPFKIMLKELLACGWTYRPGGALSYYWYFRPGAVLDKRIAPGVDYFTSEEDTIARQAASAASTARAADDESLVFNAACSPTQSSPGKARHGRGPEPAADAAVAEADGDDGDDGDVAFADDDADDADDSDGAAPAASDDDAAVAEAEEDDEPAPDGLAASRPGRPTLASRPRGGAAAAAGAADDALRPRRGRDGDAGAKAPVSDTARRTARRRRRVPRRGRVVSRVGDPAVAEALRALAGDARESLKGGLAYVPDDDACVAAVALGVAAAADGEDSVRRRRARRRGLLQGRGAKNRRAKRAPPEDGKKQSKRSRRCDARDCREALEAKADALWVAAQGELIWPTDAAVRAYKPAECEATTLNLLEDHARKRFGLWRGSSRAGASAQRATAWRRACPGGRGRSTALGVARRLVSALNKRGDRTIFVVHSADGKRLRSPDAQRALAALRSETTHLVASLDHCNAPLLWDGDSEANWLAADGTTFDWFDREAPRLGALAGSADAAKAGAGKRLDTSGLEFVLLSLTPRHVEILKLLAAHQKALRDRPKHVKERPGADQAAPEGMLFKAPKAECRYKMIATSEDQVKNYLVELTDHNLVTKKVHLGSVFVCMAPDYVDKILAANVRRREAQGRAGRPRRFSGGAPGSASSAASRRGAARPCT
ncbi:hypothetical protein JL720_2414 [Aureococcus anophagefferens]|nr:hypothetical protein JL720_2414 [Aureococcus anophagefferens]